MRNKFIIISILAVILSSCIPNGRRIFLKADKVDGLTTGVPVTFKEFRIGEISGMQLDKQGQVIITLDLEKNPEIPRDSKFKIESTDLLGSKEIVVELGSAGNLLQSGDTANLIEEPGILQSDSLTAKAMDLLETITGTRKRDSILQELQKLNSNLEELKKEK